jgi:hypothetical protein
MASNGCIMLTDGYQQQIKDQTTVSLKKDLIQGTTGYTGRPREQPLMYASDQPHDEYSVNSEVERAIVRLHDTHF